MLDLRAHFSRFLGADPERLHFAAHSHGAWPDVTREAQIQAWDDAARLMDQKWAHVLGPVLEEAQGHVARLLGLDQPDTIVFAPNTHDFVRRILSCMPLGSPPRVLTTDGEFHSFARQLARLEEDGLVAVERVPVQPFRTFGQRFAAAAARGHDLVWLSQVFFNSGFEVTDLEAVAAACGEAFLVIDGYHGFLAGPTGLGPLADRAFYMAGGYKYAVAGEGVCFMHCPPGWGPRPRDTGWYAAFTALSNPQDGRVPYAEDGSRFLGATFDPSGLYRWNAVGRWLTSEGIGVEAIRTHAHALQRLFVDGLQQAGLEEWREHLVVPLENPARGNFLTFELPDAQDWQRRWREAGIVTDVRGSRLRVGFGLYHAEEDVARLLDRLERLHAPERLARAAG